jgi:[ribosomal protein S5]-alanine N-acetyltransferase
MHTVFETERLLVRRYTLADEENFFRLNNDIDVVRYIRPPKTREESHEFLLQNLAMYEQFPFMGRWAMIHKPTDTFIGSFAVFPIENTMDIQLGYSLFAEHWGKGYATESILTGRQYAFDNLCLKEIYAITEKENTASQNALFKTGFSRISDKVEHGKTLFRFASANPDHIETKRLRIFPLTPHHLRVYLQADDKFENMLGLSHFGRIVVTPVRERVEKFSLPLIEAAPAHLRIFYTFWLAVEKNTNIIVAELGFKGAPGADGRVEIGYGTMPYQQGRGIMTEAVGGIVDWAAKRDDVRTVVAETDKANTASIRILQKNNFTQYDTKGNMLWWQKEVSNQNSGFTPV